MRIHLAIAAAILVVAIIGGVWLARPSHSKPQGVIAMRNDIAQSDAVVVTYFDHGAPDAMTPKSGLPDPATITFIQGKGWIWQVPPGPNGMPAGMVIAKTSQMLTAVAPGCYIPIPRAMTPPPPLVPGVNLARDLDEAPGLSHKGDVYTYTTGDESGSDLTHVSEDLEGIAQNQSYTAQIVSNQPGSPKSSTSTYSVRKATQAERAAATRLLTTARASAVTPLTVDVRVLVADAQPGVETVQTEHFVSPQDCPAHLALDLSSLGGAPVTIEGFREMPPITMWTIGNDAVTVSEAVPVADITAPPADLLSELHSGTAHRIDFHPGVTFGRAGPPASNPAPGVTVQIQAEFIHVDSCQPASWFPC